MPSLTQTTCLLSRHREAQYSLSRIQQRWPRNGRAVLNATSALWPIIITLLLLHEIAEVYVSTLWTTSTILGHSEHHLDALPGPIIEPVHRFLMVALKFDYPFYSAARRRRLQSSSPTTSQTGSTAHAQAAVIATAITTSSCHEMDVLNHVREAVRGTAPRCIRSTPLPRTHPSSPEGDFLGATAFATKQQMYLEPKWPTIVSSATLS